MSQPPLPLPRKTVNDVEKKIEEEELRVTDWEVLMGFVASGVEPRGIKLVDNFWDNYKKIYDEEFNKNGYFKKLVRRINPTNENPYLAPAVVDDNK